MAAQMSKPQAANQTHLGPILLGQRSPCRVFPVTNFRGGQAVQSSGAQPCLAPREALRGWSLGPSGSRLQEPRPSLGHSRLGHWAPWSPHLQPHSRSLGAQPEHQTRPQAGNPPAPSYEGGVGGRPCVGEASSPRTLRARWTGWDRHPERVASAGPCGPIHVGSNPGSQGASQPCPDDHGSTGTPHPERPCWTLCW